MDYEFAYITTGRAECKHSVSSLDGEVGYFGMLLMGGIFDKSFIYQRYRGYGVERDSAG